MRAAGKRSTNVTARIETLRADVDMMISVNPETLCRIRI
jgi:hypothetical protein